MAAKCHRALASIYLQANSRRAVTVAQARVDRLLASDPIRNAHRMSEGMYVIDVPPLVVAYTVHTTQRLVQVVGVHFTP